MPEIRPKSAPQQDSEAPPPLPRSDRRLMWIVIGVACGLVLLETVVVTVVLLARESPRPDPLVERRRALEDLFPDEKPDARRDWAEPRFGEAGKGSGKSIGLEKSEQPKSEEGSTSILTLPPAPHLYDQKVKDLEQKLKDATDAYNTEKAAKESATKEATDARAKQQAAEDKLKQFVPPQGMTSISVRQGDAIKLPRDKGDHKTAEMQGMPTEVLLIEPPQAHELKSFALGDNHKFAAEFKGTRGLEFEFTFRATPQAGKPGGLHWFTVTVKTRTTPSAQGPRFTVETRAPPCVNKLEEQERRGFIEFMRQYRLAIVERGDRRITVCSFEEGN